MTYMGTPPSSGTLTTELVVGITGANHDTGMVMVNDPFGRQFEVDATIRPKGTGFPVVGEQWLLRKRGALWALDALIGAGVPDEITGSRYGMHPIVEQMLDALIAQGLLRDGTTPTDENLIIDDGNDPVEPDPADDTIYEPPETTPPAHNPEPSPPPEDNGPSPHDPRDDEEKAENRKWYGWEPLYLGSYNLYNGVGEQRAKMDLHRLHRSKMQVVGLQEMAASPRRRVLGQMEEWGWTVFQDKSTYPRSQNPIAWRKDQFRLLNSGTFIPASHLQTTGDPIISVCWVKLEHKASGRAFFFANTHLSSKIEGRVAWSEHIELHGRPSPRGDLQRRVDYNHATIKEIKAWVRERARNVPVFLSGDFNIDFYDDRRHRTPNFPFMQWKEIDFRSNWGLISKRTNIATHSSRRWIDQIWSARSAHHQVKFRSHWVLTGYHSDHRPVLVKTSIRSKKAPRRRG